MNAEKREYRKAFVWLVVIKVLMLAIGVVVLWSGFKMLGVSFDLPFWRMVTGSLLIALAFRFIWLA